MNLLDRFERIYIVNLPHRADRRREMAEQLARVGLSFDSPGVVLFKAVRPDDAGGFSSIGARGCFMSHLGILRDALGRSSVLILEDDLDFVADIGTRLARALESLPADWGIFYGGCRIDVPPSATPLTRILPTTPLGTSHFVAFNGPVIGRLVAYLEAILGRPPGHADGGPMHVDGAYSHFRADNIDVATDVALPELGFQRPSRTDIHALRWFDRAPVVRDLAQLARRWRARRRRG